MKKRKVNVDALFADVRPVHPLSEMVVGNIRKERHYHNEFRKLFGMDLGRFMHPFFGFDVIKLDDFFRPPEGQSLQDCILARFGQDAVDLVVALIGYKE